ncbi:MAG: hypothetical protein J7647_29230 [Cyanobacteria bacterium SBLK]|nr:hypothetical protein [Cyanobacteria bacterium SBLK]
MLDTKRLPRQKRLTPQESLVTQHQGNRQIIRLTSRRVNSRSPTPPKRSNYGGWRLSLFVPIAAIIVVAGAGISALWLLQRLPWQNCQNLAPMASDSERFYCAQLAAQSGREDDLIAAIALVESWDSDRPLYWEVQKFLDGWSDQFWQQAEEQIHLGNLSEALRLASLVSPRSSYHARARSAIAAWEEEWAKGEELTHEFDLALKSGNWQQSLAIARRFSTFESKYWREERADALMLRLARGEKIGGIVNEEEEFLIPPFSLNSPTVFPSQ